jgi:hypothetical protein
MLISYLVDLREQVLSITLYKIPGMHVTAEWLYSRQEWPRAEPCAKTKII